MKVIIDRLNEGEKQTESLLTILNEKEETIFNCYTLELPWNDNKKQISCIPKGEYNVDEAKYNLNISYEYYWDDGDYFSPPESDLEILQVTLNGMDITDFYWDWVDDAIHSQVWDYAQENRNE